MKRFLTTLPALFLLALSSFSQQIPHDHRSCGFDQFHEKHYQENPEYRLNIQLNEEQISQYYKEVQKSGGNRKAGVVTIPIVFHIIHKGEAVGTGTNISDEQIQSAIDGMNIQYRNKKPDGSVFDPAGVDLEMEFCLAQKDPNGQPTSGINRVNGTSVANYSTQGIINSNEQAVKALSKWDNKKYYNVWVVAMINGQDPTGGGTQGYAYFPGAGPAVDGTVVLYNACGYCPAGNCPGFNLKSFARDNGTMVHEIGHAFALYHTFHPGGNGNASDPCPPNSNCATSGDLICDTDPHQGNLGSCKNVGDANPCTGGTYDVKIARNYMNYTNCSPLIFTAGQRDRVQAQFATTSSGRYSLTVSDGCDPVYPYDLALRKLIAPGGFQCDKEIYATIQVKNTGQNTLTSFNIEYGIDGTVLNNYLWTGNLANNTEITINLPVITSGTGTHNFFARVVKNSLNGTQTDGYSVNDNVSGNFEIIDGAQVQVNVKDYASGDKIEIIKTSTGAIIKTINLDDGNSEYNETVCLPKDCYNFRFTDIAWIPAFYIVNGVPGKIPKFSVKDDKGYEIAGAFTDPNTAPPGGVQNPKAETDNNICIPFNPGYLEADFKADKLIVEQGKVVQFTDLSKLSAGSPANAPLANSWSWDFGDAQSSNLQNPSHVYGTPGVYTVKLAANNGIVPDTAEKIHYIRVIPTLDGCDQFNNLLSGEVPGFKTMVNNVKGYYPGPNVLKPAAYAEKFWTPASSNLMSAEVFISKKYDATGTSKVTFAVYTMLQGKPNVVQGSVQVPISSLVEGTYNTITFPNPIPVSDYYFVGMAGSANPADTVVLGASDYRGNGDMSNTAFINYGGSWAEVPNVISASSANSLAITTNLSLIPAGNIESDTKQTCENKDISFDASTSDFANSYEWLFEDGTPSTSTLQKPVVNYTTVGTKNVRLIVSGGCGEKDTVQTTIKVTPAPTVTVNVVDEVCGGSNGQATAVTSGGSGTYSYDWGMNPPQYTNPVTSLKAGTYTVIMNDLKCGSVVTSFTVKNLNQLAVFPVDVTHTTCGLKNGMARAYPTGGTGTYTYKWMKSGDPNFLQTGSQISSLEPGTYSVEVSDNSCNPTTVSFVVGSSQGVSGTLTASRTLLCQGDNTTLTATGGSSYEWSDLYGPVGNTSEITVSPASSNMYTVKIIDNGCMQILKQDISVTPSPRAFAKVDTDNDDVYQESVVVDLKDGGFVFFSSAGSQGTSYFWDFADSNTSNTKNPFHRYTQTGIFTVYLTVDLEGCTQRDTCQVIVIDTRNTSVGNNPAGDISLYPNPTGGDLWLKKGSAVIEEIIVYDALGKTVSVVPAPVNDKIDLRHLSVGLYMVHIRTREGSIVQRIEIQK